MSTALLLLAACAFSAAVALQSNWNQGARNKILEIHNDYRRNEGGCQINELVYDDALEAAARKWAEGCVFKHEMVRGRGENLAWNTEKKGEVEMLTKAMAGWFSEKKDFRYGQRGCSRSCHYTQLVWYNTQKVGCWSTRCPNLVNAHSDAYYLVCFYTPMGNWIGQQPYKKQCKTPCSPGQTPKNGLCEGEEIIPCVDEDTVNCPKWAKFGECGNNPIYMKKHCRKSCEVCK